MALPDAPAQSTAHRARWMPAPTAALDVQARERDLLHELGESGHLVALVDAAGLPAVYAHLAARAAAEPDAVCPLFAGPVDDERAAVTPWLVRADAAVLAWTDAPPADEPADNALLASVTAPLADDEDDLPADGDGAADDTVDGHAAAAVPPPPAALPPWAAGVYVLARLPWNARPDLRRLRRRLARLLTVRLPEGDLVYLRLADPRVLPPLLGASTAARLAEVFGPEIGAFVIARPDAEEVAVLTRAATPIALPRPRVFLPPPTEPAVDVQVAEG